MDTLLKGLFGDQNDDQKRNQAQDFVNRYEQGAPADGITADEAVSNYQAVAGQISPQELEDSADEAFQRLSPDERREFAQWLKERGGDQVGDLNGDDPRQMAQVTTHLQQNQPDGLAGLLGGGSLASILGGGGGLGGLIGGNSSNNSGIGGMLTGAMGGGRGRQQDQGGGMSDMLQNPIARAVLGGIAAMAMKKMMGRR
ncbi:MAG: hypothetical protein ACR2OU_10870 [Thermomicrobiales bacterium]